MLRVVEIGRRDPDGVDVRALAHLFDARENLAAVLLLKSLQALFADIRKEGLKAFQEKYGGKVFASVKEMCESPDIDAVWIATPNLHHAEHAILAAENGKHVICEKPLAVTLEECDRMIDAAERNKVKLLQGHSKIYEPAIKKMREIVASGELGRLLQIHTFNYRNWILRPRVDVEARNLRHHGGCFGR